MIRCFAFLAAMMRLRSNVNPCAAGCFGGGHVFDVRAGPMPTWSPSTPVPFSIVDNKQQVTRKTRNNVRRAAQTQRRRKRRRPIPHNHRWSAASACLGHCEIRHRVFEVRKHRGIISLSCLPPVTGAGSLLLDSHELARPASSRSASLPPDGWSQPCGLAV